MCKVSSESKQRELGLNDVYTTGAQFGDGVGGGGGGGVVVGQDEYKKFALVTKRKSRRVVTTFLFLSIKV